MAVVYAVKCADTGFVYVGCAARRLNRRLNEHRSRLKQKIHTGSEKMIVDFEAYGPKSFSINVLETLPENAPVEIRREAELRWMGHFKDKGLLYNAQMISFGPGAGFRKGTQTAEARMKRSLALKGKKKHPGHGAKISATKKALGQRPSREACEKSQLSRRTRKANEIVSSASKKEDAGS